MKAADTSVAVAAFGEWHAQNSEARRLLDAGAFLPVHAMLETYSVLTGFPPPYRSSPAVVLEWMENRFAGLLPIPTPEQHRDLVSTLADAGRVGGAVYDGLIGLSAMLADAELVTADKRAAGIYDLLGVRWLQLD